jgi:hypothetical protein
VLPAPPEVAAPDVPPPAPEPPLPPAIPAKAAPPPADSKLLKDELDPCAGVPVAPLPPAPTVTA